MNILHTKKLVNCKFKITKVLIITILDEKNKVLKKNKGRDQDHQNEEIVKGIIEEKEGVKEIEDVMGTEFEREIDYLLKEREFAK